MCSGIKGTVKIRKDNMDNLAEKLAKVFGSAPFIIFHFMWFTIWIVLNFIMKFDPEYSLLTIVVSLEAIFLSLFILRAENIQSERLEKKIKKDVKRSEEDIKNTKKVLRKLDKK